MIPAKDETTHVFATTWAMRSWLVQLPGSLQWLMKFCLFIYIYIHGLGFHPYIQQKNLGQLVTVHFSFLIDCFFNAWQATKKNSLQNPEISVGGKKKIFSGSSFHSAWNPKKQPVLSWWKWSNGDFQPLSKESFGIIIQFETTIKKFGSSKCLFGKINLLHFFTLFL